MNIIFDNIIYSLQKAGGVSVVWTELISRMLENSDFSCNFLEFKNSDNNIYRKNLVINPDKVILNSSLLNHNPYVSPRVKAKANFIFHSSYYRTCNNKRAKNVTTVHDFIYEYYRTGLPKLVHHYQKKNGLLCSVAIICVTNNTKNDLLRFFPSIPEDRVFVIYNGVSESFRLLGNDKIPTFALKLGKYALYIGNRVQPHKNFNPIIDAISKIKDLNLVLVGGGEITKSEFAILSIKLSNKYVHFNNIDNDTLNILYNYAHVLIYPSHYEGFGIPIIEAQKAGCPVIAKKGSSITEVAQDSALLMNVGNSEEIIQSLSSLEKFEFRNELKEKGFLNSQRFSWDKMAKEVLDVYKIL